MLLVQRSDVVGGRTADRNGYPGEEVVKCVFVSQAEGNAFSLGAGWGWNDTVGKSNQLHIEWWQLEPTRLTMERERERR